MTTPERIALWLCSNFVFYLIAVIAFAVWIQREVDGEFRLGLRDGSGGDKVAVPIAGFALFLGGAIVALNVILLIVRYLRSRTNTAS